MKISLAIVALLLAFGAVSLAQETPPWATKGYHVLVDGNQLYADCQVAEKTVRKTGKDIETDSNAGNDLFAAGRCWGYIMGVVDSIPAGEGFEPDAEVKGSQYVDVVLAYLRDHPESRHQPAHFLTRYALTQAFPAKSKH